MFVTPEKYVGWNKENKYLKSWRGRCQYNISGNYRKAFFEGCFTEIFIE